MVVSYLSWFKGHNEKKKEIRNLERETEIYMQTACIRTRTRKKIRNLEGEASDERKSIKREINWRSGRDNDLVMVNSGGGLPG